MNPNLHAGIGSESRTLKNVRCHCSFLFHALRRWRAVTNSGFQQGGGDEPNPLINEVIDVWHHLPMNMPHAVHGASNQISQGDINIHGNNGNVSINQHTTATSDPASKTVATGLPLAAHGCAASTVPLASDTEVTDADGKEAGIVHVVPTQRTGQGGLPFMPDGLVPAEQYKMGDGNTHMKKYFAWFWILDECRGDQWRTNVKEDETQYDKFRQLIETLREEIGEASKKIFREKVIENFVESKLQLQGQGVSEFSRDISEFIRSPQLKAAFAIHPKIPFALLMKVVYSLCCPTRVKEWLCPKLQQWARQRTKCAFDIEWDPNTPRVHSVFGAANNYIKQITASIHLVEMITFGMTLRMRLGKSDDQHVIVPVNLGSVANPQGMKTYLVVDVSRHEWARKLKNKKEKERKDSDLAECRGCEDFQFYSYMMAQEALARGLTMNQAKGHAMAAMDQAYGSGSGMLPPLPGTEHCTQWAKEFEQKLFPPKNINDQACGSGVGLLPPSRLLSNGQPKMPHAIPWQALHGWPGCPPTHGHSMDHNPPYSLNQGRDDSIMVVCKCHFYHTIN